jgi:23S rRNA (adenine2503-C2)-methyltransferase
LNDSAERVNIFDLSLPDLEQVFLGWGAERFRAMQVWKGIYQQLISIPQDLRGLPGAFREHLESEFSLQTLQTREIRRSSGGQTTKYAFDIPGGGTIETVLMKYEERRTACISTQAGCALGCVFCATGQMGLLRNLTSGEIVEQVLILARDLRKDGERLTNIVIMGMGEPFHNYDATLAAINTLNHPDGFNFGSRRFTISTVGLVPIIHRFAEEQLQVNLAVSLHAATNTLRNQLMPVNRKYPLEQLIPACRDYVQKTRRRISFEWALIDGINDGLDQAEALVDLLHGLNCHVNLIPLNETSGFGGGPASREKAKAFQDHLQKAGISCTIRIRRGLDIEAGCGQLATKTSSHSHSRR